MAGTSRAEEPVVVLDSDDDEEEGVNPVDPEDIMEILRKPGPTNVSSVVIYMDSDDDDDGKEKRPLMLLLHERITNKKTEITDTKLTRILEKEFNVSIKWCLGIEVRVCKETVKKFVGIWSEWAELDRLSTQHSNPEDEALKKVLEGKYEHLKKYLTDKVDIAKRLVRRATRKRPHSSANPETPNPVPETVKNVPSGSAVLVGGSLAPKNVKINTPVTGTINPKDIFLHIECTKEKLHELFYRRPRTDRNNTVFNLDKVARIPPRNPLKNLSCERILNGWCLKISINLPQFKFIRQITYNLNHVLVNRVHYKSYSDMQVDTFLQQKCDQVNQSESHTTDAIIKQLGDILDACLTQNYELNDSIHCIFSTIISELHDFFDGDCLYEVPAWYRKPANKFKYIRYFCTENEQNDDPRYDLQLEEALAPSYNYYIGNLGKIENIPPIAEWLKFECMYCLTEIPITAETVGQKLEDHFNAFHQHERDWECTHCKKSFTIDYLSNNKWFHEC
ncbi:hypothetical protein PYW07_000328 [Mythimna separata]|uniref:Uncharacterized protein n=1 Tax=Mythimna separata TaxID=271217 RepID=A0AAD7Z1Y8_MYTSE|nr:hypothetical protein PYW07_000328 [Mythimna separata]